MKKFIFLIIFCMILLPMLKENNKEILFIRSNIQEGYIVNNIIVKAFESDKFFYNDGTNTNDGYVFLNQIPEHLYYSIIKSSGLKFSQDYYLFLFKTIIYYLILLAYFISGIYILFYIFKYFY